MFKPINAWIFIRRDETEAKHLGLDISEGARVKSLTGTVAFGDGQTVKPGDRVHLPHYKVVDYEIFGVEYAVVKESDLFAIEKHGIFHPINQYVKVRKCENDHIRDESGDIALYMTENNIQFTNWVEILEVADDCHPALKENIGWFFVAPENDENVRRLGHSYDYMVHESLIEFITDGD